MFVTQLMSIDNVIYFNTIVFFPLHDKSTGLYEITIVHKLESHSHVATETILKFKIIMFLSISNFPNIIFAFVKID